MKQSRRFYIDALCSIKCLCGAPKQGPRGRVKAHSFCKSCYQRLPGDIKSDLYSPVGVGYEEAVDAAMKFLEKEAP